MVASVVAAVAAPRSPPRALLLPFPAQGHVIPLMDLAHRLVCSGFKITFVNSEYDYARVVASATSPLLQDTGGGIRVATLPDGLGPNESRSGLGRLCTSLLQSMPGRLEQLIREEGEAGRPVTCIIADGFMAWALDVAAKFGLAAAIMWPASAESFVDLLNKSKLVDNGIIDKDLGLTTNNKQHQPTPGGASPLTNSPYNFGEIKDLDSRGSIFQYFCAMARLMKNGKFIVCNSFLELERPLFTSEPRILPIGPYLPNNNINVASFSRSSYWAPDRDCLRWLDTQTPGFVVYVSFGSMAILGLQQFTELALGLEMSGRPFLWVIRSDLVIDGGSNHGALCYPPGFQERIAGRGRIVEWAPQREVLAHPAVACFLSHCGWNSTVEGVGNGVPFLCWPYFFDQIPNSDSICNVWRTGIRVVPDGDGLVLKDQVREKLDDVLWDEGILARALELKETARRNMERGGTSYDNFNMFDAGMRKLSLVVS